MIKQLCYLHSRLLVHDIKHVDIVISFRINAGIMPIQ